jgi:hypothetical protein
MRISLLLAAALTCVLADGDQAGASPVQRSTQHGPFCQRNNAVVGLSVVAELNRGYIYGGCTRVSICRPGYAMGNLQTISIDGYNDPANWLWQGYSDHAFTIIEQNSILSAGETKAIGSTPPGKSLATIVFFGDVIVGLEPYPIFLGEKATYGRCSFVGQNFRPQ